ncbi:hypothetical protein ACSSWA_11885 [Melioribacter sp. Ez-97]|uniref:hypothetical protein n=1 Tax=Melioribacter sp. Ez-97 TaxID=3423434 RepID=UPI003ED8A18A
MNESKKRYQIVAALLLTAILSHISLFHFELQQKVLCIGERNHFQIENIGDAHSSLKFTINLGFFQIIENDDCTEFKLDNHIDEDIVKVISKNTVRFNEVLIINFDTIKKDDKFSIIEDNLLTSHNTGLESLAKISLLI